MITCKNGHETDIKKMTLKMGGLLCPKCSTIVFAPYVDKEYFEEYNRRKSGWDKEEENKRKREQEGS